MLYLISNLTFERSKDINSFITLVSYFTELYYPNPIQRLLPPENHFLFWFMMSNWSHFFSKNGIFFKNCSDISTYKCEKKYILTPPDQVSVGYYCAPQCGYFSNSICWLFSSDFDPADVFYGWPPNQEKLSNYSKITYSKKAIVQCESVGCKKDILSIFSDFWCENQVEK